MLQSGQIHQEPNTPRRLKHLAPLGMFRAPEADRTEPATSAAGASAASSRLASEMSASENCAPMGHQRSRRPGQRKQQTLTMPSTPLAVLLLFLFTLGATELAHSSGELHQAPHLGGRASSALAAAKRKLVPSNELLARSSNQLGDWLVRSVAPVVATRIIDNVLQKPNTGSSGAKTGAKSSASPIDTQALADTIVERLADGIKRRKSELAGRSAAVSGSDSGAASTAGATTVAESNTQQGAAKTARRGKSLVSDSVQQVMQNLLPLASGATASLASVGGGQRTLFGRAIERHRQLSGLHAFAGHPHHFNQMQQQQPVRSSSSNSWSLLGPKQPEPEQLVVMPSSTDSSQLDENPVVIRAEHGHNLTTMSPPAFSQHHQNVYNSQQRQQQLLKQKQQQQQQQQQKYVHTNRHNQQQQLAPKPQWQSGNKRQQSPYSFSLQSNQPTSDINIVQAPSSPPPPPMSSSTTSTTTQQPTTSSSTTTTTALPMVFPQVSQTGPNKFKFNNRHQMASSSVAIAPNAWFSSNQPQRFQHQQHHHNHHQSARPHQTTSTTSTTSTTPEPPPPTQTDYVMAPDMTGDELGQSPSPAASAMSSILSSVAQSALETLGSSSSQAANEIDSAPYNPHLGAGSNFTAANLQSSSSGDVSVANRGATKTSQAPPATTSARHSVITAEAIPTALGAPLYHLTRNFTTHSIIGSHQMSALSPPRRSGLAAFTGPAANSPAAKALAQYFQKGVNNLSLTIFGRQSKGWARRLGLSSMLLGLVYGAAVLSNPGAPLPTNGVEVLKALTKGLTSASAASKKRRTYGSELRLGSSAGELAASQINELLANGASSTSSETIDRNTAALLDNNVSLLYQQQPQLVAIIEQLLQQEQQALLRRQQQQQQPAQGSSFSQRSFSVNDMLNNKEPPPIEIEDVSQEDDDDDNYHSQRPSRRSEPRYANQKSTTTTNSLVSSMFN